MIGNTEIAKCSCAKKSIEAACFNLGLSTVADVAWKAGCSIDAASSVVKSLPNFHWTDQATGYGWVDGSKPNLLLLHIKKVLRVSPVVGLPELHEAIHKVHLLRTLSSPRGRKPRPPIPLPVLSTFCRQMNLVVEGQFVRSPKAVEAVVLGGIEDELFKLLENAPHCAHRNSIQRHFAALGVSDACFESTMSVSPIIMKMEKYVWRLVGSKPTTAEVSAVLTSEPSPQPPCCAYDRVQVTDNTITVRFPITTRNRANGGAYIPKNVRDQIQGPYELYSDNAFLCTMNAVGPDLMGLSQFFRGFAENEMRLNFDTTTRKARLVS